MIRDITLGQYYPADSVLHRLDSRVKLISTLVFLVSMFLVKNISGFLIATIFLGGVIICSKIPFKFIVKGLKAIIVLLLFSVIFTLFFEKGEPLIQFWIIKITKQGLQKAGFTVGRMTYLICGSSLMTLTTTPNDLTDGLERLLNPLKKIKVPVHEIAMMMSVALRFIPILLEETDKIMKAQIARGADFEEKGLLKKAKSLIPLLVPLFISAFRRADDLGLAMEARCYQGGEGRTKMKPLVFKSMDYISFLVVLSYFVILLLINQYL
jgi:ABC-type cobalt transport system, permease component CbiQ and related transporters